MEHYKIVKEDVTKLDDITCDICGKSCKTIGSPEYMHLYAMWGYYSQWDSECWEAHVCPSCVKEKLDPIIIFKKM